MKNVPAISLNVAYWFIFAVMMSFIYNAIRYPTFIFFPVLPDPEIFSSLGWLILLPSAISFYAGYIYFFNSLLIKRKALKLVAAMFTLAFACATLVMLLTFLLHPVSNGVPLIWQTFTLYSLHFIFLSLLNSSGGLVIRGFVACLSSSEPRQIPANTI